METKLPLWKKHTGNGNAKHYFCRHKHYEHFCKVSASSSLWLLRRWFFFFFFLIFWLGWQPIQFSCLNKFKWFLEDYSRNISLKHLSKQLQWNSKKTYFNFSHYKSMQTLSCHSDKCTWAIATKNKLLVEAYIMNISWKFQFHSLMASERIFEDHLANLMFLLLWQPIQISNLDKIHM